jgi:hypothetical protein
MTMKITKKRVAAEAWVFFVRARYWIKRSKAIGWAPLLSGCVVIVAMALLCESLNEQSLASKNGAAKVADDGGRFFAWGAVFVGAVGMLTVSVAVARKIRSAGSATNEKRQIEGAIAQLRGEARAKKEAEQIQAAIGAGSDANTSLGADEAPRRLPKRI